VSFFVCFLCPSQHRNRARLVLTTALYLVVSTSVPARPTSATPRGTPQVGKSFAFEHGVRGEPRNGESFLHETLRRERLDSSPRLTLGHGARGDPATRFPCLDETARRELGAPSSSAQCFRFLPELHNSAPIVQLLSCVVVDHCVIQSFEKGDIVVVVNFRHLNDD
jgi:hypothetical protein